MKQNKKRLQHSINSKQTAMEMLNRYIELNHLRKTSERNAILDTAYDIKGPFSLDQLSSLLEERHFTVSRATLYNNMRLFVELRIILCHRFQRQTMFQACCDSQGFCHQICTVCGDMKEIKVNNISDVIDELKLKRFRRDFFTLYIYGVCTACQTRINRLKRNAWKKKSTKIK